MQGSLKCLLSQVIDYAGLFPPAGLSMEESVSEYRKWLAHPFSAGLGRFCCPVDRLAELLTLELGPEPLSISAIARAATDREEWLNLRDRDAQLMTSFETRCGDRAEISAYEVRIPPDGQWETYFDELQGFSAVDVFAELPWQENMSDMAASAAESDWLALKARTGGIKAGDVPSPEALAEFIWLCMSLELPFKLTAGLHHALPNRNPDTGDRQHGFLNVLTAATLAYAEDLPAPELVRILKTDTASEWTFGANEMRFGDNAVPIDIIESARSVCIGFGSCSISEPVADLSGLGWS